MKLPKNLGMFVLGVWLIFFGLTGGLFGLEVHFAYAHDLAGLLAIIAGILLLLGR
jgi:hypothetical protein